MKTVLIGVLTLLSTTICGQERRVYQQDAYGNAQYHKSSYTVEKDGRIIETDAYGNKQYHKQQYQMNDGKIFPVDSSGNVEHDKPAYTDK